MGWNFCAVDENGECLGSLIVQYCEKLVFCCQKAFEHCEMRLFVRELALIGYYYIPSSGPQPSPGRKFLLVRVWSCCWRTRRRDKVTRKVIKFAHPTMRLTPFLISLSDYAPVTFDKVNLHDPPVCSFPKRGGRRHPAACTCCTPLK